MNKVYTMKRNLPSVCIGLVIGTVLPIVLFLVLAVVDGVIINVAYSRFGTDIGLAISQLYTLLIPVEIISLLFLAKFNKTLTVAALPTAIIVTAYVSYVTAKFVPFAPG